MRLKFKFRPIPLIATVILVAVGIALGQWQTRRALQKESIQAQLLTRAADPVVALGAERLTANAVEYRRVTVRGEFRTDWPLYLDNRPYNGAAGFYLLMPFKIGDSDRYILVERGWTPRNSAVRTQMRQISTPAGVITIEGVARRNPGRLFEFGSAGQLHPGAIVQNINVAQFSAATKLELQPFVLEQSTATADGLVRDWPRPSSGAATNRGYAFQWYGLALMAFLFFFVTGFRHGKK